MKVWIVEYYDKPGRTYIKGVCLSEDIAKSLSEQCGGSYFAMQLETAGEPVFLMRGRDAFTEIAIAARINELGLHGAVEQADEEDEALSEILRWQRDNPDKVKVPDRKHVPVGSVGGN